MYSILCRPATRPSLSVVANSLSAFVAVDKSGSMGRSKKGRQLSACTTGGALHSLYLCISDSARPVSRRVAACAPFPSLPLPHPTSLMVARAGDRSSVLGPSGPARGAIMDCGGGAASLAVGGVSPAVADDMRAGSRCAKPIARYPRCTHAACMRCKLMQPRWCGGVMYVARKPQESQWGSLALSSALPAFCDGTARGALPR
ncbi:hypothetical protein DFH06DRAFT_1220505 [Mycena polygramma]|nr:hypothetical protein DFH06DRAFT_1220505 [Mycena polygramma]